MFNVSEMVGAVGGKLVAGAENKEFSNFSKDTRTIKNGDFYIPLIGEQFDGHDYIPDAIQKGASGFFLSKKYARREELIQEAMSLNSEIVIIEVDDTLLALQTLAGYNRDRKSQVKLIAVTGSVGKTSTKEMIHSVLEKGFHILKTEGNLNNEIGLPLTLLRLNDEEVCVVEMGMSSFGEISLLSKLAKPDIAVITNIGVAHIGILGSRENIFKAKQEILNGLKENGTLIVNGDDQFLKTLESSDHLKVIKYGIENTDVDIQASDISNEKSSTVFHVDHTKYRLNCIGRHNIYNALCAMAVGRELGLQEEQFVEGYSGYKNENMRMQQVHLKKDILLINDAYNANFDSMKAGIEAVDALQAKRKILVLGDMYELGEYSVDHHRKIGELLTGKNPDLLITCGKDSIEISNAMKKGSENPAYHFEDKKDAISKLKEIVSEGDLIYFKASRGMKFEEIVNAIIEYIGK
jgi:UDP-N-acetylmuramoyl-tripeptide--D-alanyl-D-alanine ligase